eukprot:COSAG05_NODE_25_length_31349_cov_4.978560_26_plen_85_part_00
MHTPTLVGTTVCALGVGPLGYLQRARPETHSYVSYSPGPDGNDKRNCTVAKFSVRLMILVLGSLYPFPSFLVAISLLPPSSVQC